MEFRALHETTTYYSTRALTELVSTHLALEIALEQLQYQQSFNAPPTVAAGEINRYDSSDKSRCPNDAAERFDVRGAVQVSPISSQK